MQIRQLVLKFGRNDVKLIGRDHFLVLMLFFVLYIAIALRFGLPWLDGYLAENGILPSESVPMSLAHFYPLLVGYMAVFQGALIAGTIFGFALLDEKDDDTIKAMLVTPVPFTHYVMYRVAVPIVLAFFTVIAMVLFIGQALIPLWQLILISTGASLTAPIATLFYGIFAENKVQGFAMAKFVGIAGGTILLGWFVDEPLQWLFGLFPPFWISKAYWMAYYGHNLWWLALIVGILLQTALIYLLIQRFNKVAYR
ncbi:MAG: hypothetical protein ACPGWR_15510 [Ardenticatenaceae bacterium]